MWERLHLLAGLRLALVHMQGADAVAGSNFVTDAWKPLPRAGAVLDVARGISVFADYSQGFRGVPFFSNPTTAPKPEEAEQIEGGEQARAAVRLQRHAVVFRPSPAAT